VVLVALSGGAVVVKDFRGRARWLRATLGRWLIARELRAYRVLAGHPSVPRLVSRIDAYAFALEYRPGRRLSRQRAAELAPEFLAQLETAVRGLHARGVAHLDLRHRSNVLVDPDGAPVLIDFASAVCLAPTRWPQRWLLRGLARIDEAALAKWRTKLGPVAGAAGASSRPPADAEIESAEKPTHPR
jgi:RIO-like serine/threonine protein kinase